MSITVSAKDYTLINACENAADWDGGGGNPADVTAFFKQGSQCVGFELWSSGNLDVFITGNWNLSGTKHLRCWFMLTALNELNTDALGGVQFLVSDGANTGYYYVSGSTTYSGGWYNSVVDLSRGVDAGTKPDMTALTTIGLRFNLTTGAKKVQSLWIDHLYIGDGLIAYGTLASPFSFDDILAADEDVANGWGIIRKIGGVYYLVGSLTFGDDADVDELDFKDISQIIIFEDRKVNTNLYNFTVVANATGATQKFQLGEVSGGAGISGCTIKSEGTAKYDVTCTDVDIDDFRMYGCTFLDADVIILPANAPAKEVLSCAFERCGKVIANTCKVQHCNFISSDADAVLISDDPHFVTDCSFINCPNGVEIDTAGDGSYDFNALKFINTTYHVNNTSGGTLEVANGNGSNASTYTGLTVNFTSSAQLTIIVRDEQTPPQPVVGAFAYIDDQDETPYIMNTITDEEGVATVPYTGAPVANARWRIRKYGYRKFKQLVDIESDDINLPITLVVDPQQF